MACSNRFVTPRDYPPGSIENAIGPSSCGCSSHVGAALPTWETAIEVAIAPVSENLAADRPGISVVAATELAAVDFPQLIKLPVEAHIWPNLTARPAGLARFTRLSSEHG